MEMPIEIMESVSNVNTENVILLAMSTLRDTEKVNHFFYNYKEERWDYYCVSQLGPETKTFLSFLDKEKKKADRIVILETEDTKVPIPAIGKTAIQFYIDEIAAFADGKNPQEHKVNPSVFANCEICHVDIEKADAIIDAVKNILGSGEKNIALYIDVQGGLRKISTQINAIVEYLSSLDNVNIVGRYANDYKYGKEEHQIICVDDEYNTYNLVTAMDIFKKYGRGEKIKAYFEKRQYSDPFAIKLADAIELAAKSIQQCDVDGFDEAIEKIRELNNIYDADTVSAELQLIFNDITEDYKPLFAAKYRYVEQIRWCIKKNFIQQAMTILESKMPDEYVLNGLKYFAVEGDDIDEILGVLEDIYLKNYSYINSKTKKRMISNNAYKMKNVNHYFINYYYFDVKDNNDKKGSDKKLSKSLDVRYGTKEKRIEDNLKVYRGIKELRNEMNHAHSTINSNGFIKMMRAKHPDFANKYVNNRTNVNLSEMIINYINDWERLANEVPDEIKSKIIDLR